MRTLPYFSALLVVAAAAGAQPAKPTPVALPPSKWAEEPLLPMPAEPPQKVYAPMAPAPAEAVLALKYALGTPDVPLPPLKFRSTFSHEPVEPADSLYKLAKGALNDGDFRKAAQLFQTVVDRYPDSEYAPDALYYRAYALFRGASSSRDLVLAVQSLDRQEQRYPKAGTLGDARQLRASIRSEQARRGDSNAYDEVLKGGNQLKKESGCPTDDDEMRLTALVGLVQNDPDQVLPVLQKLLSRTDDCSVRLRKRAVNMVAQTKEEERSDILLRVASTDPNNEVRREAVLWLAEVNTERAARALDSILFSANDAEMRDRALSALARHRNPIARLSLRKFAERTNIPTELRVRAVNYIASSPRRTGDENEYLHNLFNKTASPEIREAIIEGITQMKAPDRTTWLLGVARDKSQESEVRRKAMYAAGQSGVELKDLLNLYDEMSGQPELQEQMLLVYRQRKEPEATDKLMQIAKNEKNVDLRKKAVFYLGDRKDPRVRQFLLDIVNP